MIRPIHRQNLRFEVETQMPGKAEICLEARLYAGGHLHGASQLGSTCKHTGHCLQVEYPILLISADSCGHAGEIIDTGCHSAVMAHIFTLDIETPARHGGKAFPYAYIAIIYRMSAESETPTAADSRIEEPSLSGIRLSEVYIVESAFEIPYGVSYTKIYRYHRTLAHTDGAVESVGKTIDLRTYKDAPVMGKLEKSGKGAVYAGIEFMCILSHGHTRTHTDHHLE